MKTPFLCRYDIQHETAVTSMYVPPTPESPSLTVKIEKICSQSRQLSPDQVSVMHCQKPVAVLSSPFSRPLSL